MTKSSFLSPNEGTEFSFTNWQDRFVLGILRAASVFGLVSLVAIFIDPTTSTTLRIIYVIVYLILLINTFAPIPYRWRAGFVLIVAFLLGVIELLSGGLVGAARLYLLGFVILTNLLFSYRASIMALALSAFTYATAGTAMLTNYYQPTLTIAIIGTWIDWVSSGATFIFIAATVNVALQMLQNEFQRAYESGRAMLTELQANRHTLEDRVAERTASLEKRTNELSAANAITQDIASAKEIEILLPLVVHAITEKFGYYHAGIYLLDEKTEYGYLQAASSEGGKRMLARQHQISLASEGILQRCVLKQTRQIVQDIPEDTARLEFPDLPSTRARAVFPLLVRERVIGVIDVHATQTNAFQESEIETLEIIADQFSLAIDNARLFADMQAIIEQTQQAGDTRSQLSWKELVNRKAPAYQYTPLAVQKIGIVPERRDDTGALLVPIILRGKNIGKIRLKRKSGTGTWLQQEEAMVQEISTQVALALENARLLEDAQTRASRERTLGEIATRISAATDVEAILRTTVQEVGKILGDSEIAVQLNPESMDT